MLPRIPALLVSLGLLSCLAAAPRLEAQATPELARNLQTGGDRWFARGQYRTAFRLYQAAGRSLGDLSLPPDQACRWAIAAVNSGEYRIAADLLQRVVAGPAAADCDTILARLYLGYSLARLEQWTRVLSVLRGQIDSLDREDPAIQIGALIAGKLARAGDVRGVLWTLDRLYRETGAEKGRRRVVAQMTEILAGTGIEAIAAAVNEGSLPDPAAGVLLPWLEALLASGDTARAEDLAGALSPGAGGEAFLGQVAALVARSAAGREGREIRIGVLVPLTGTYQFFGRKILQSYQLALQEYPGMGITLLVRDTGGDPETALRQARELIDERKARVILGPILSNEVEKVLPLAGDRKVAFFSPAAQAAGLPALSPWFFRNCLTLQQQARTLARVAVKTLGLTRFAILSPGDNYGKTLSRTFWDEVTALGGRVLYSAQYGLEQTDFHKEIRLIRGEEEVAEDTGGEEDSFHPSFEAVYIPDTYDRVGLIAPQLSFHDIERSEVILLGSSGLNTSDFVRIGEEYTEGTIFLDAFLAGRDDPRVRDFVGRYRARYGATPDVMAAQAYDAAAIVCTLIREGKRGAQEIRAGLAVLKDFPGVCGLTGMDQAGEGIREPVLITVVKGRLVELNLDR